MLRPTVPQRLSSRSSRRIERAFTRQRQPSDTALTACVSPDAVSGPGKVGSPRSMPPTGRAIPWDGYIDLVSRPPAMHTSNGPLFHAGSSTKPPSPQPKIGCSIMKGSDPEARQVMSTILKFGSAESPINCPRAPFSSTWEWPDSTDAPRSAERSPFFVCIRPVNERCKLVYP